jgi:hypothetical protein
MKCPDVDATDSSTGHCDGLGIKGLFSKVELVWNWSRVSSGLKWIDACMSWVSYQSAVKLEKHSIAVRATLMNHIWPGFPRMLGLPYGVVTRKFESPG